MNNYRINDTRVRAFNPLKALSSPPRGSTQPSSNMHLVSSLESQERHATGICRRQENLFTVKGANDE